MENDNFDESEGPVCPECGDEADLSPLTGVCYDCENMEDYLDEDDDEGLCVVCGYVWDEEDLKDDVCPACLEDEEEDNQLDFNTKIVLCYFSIMTIIVLFNMFKGPGF